MVTPTRIFIVGTDTAVGKTAVTAALLRTASARGLKVLPFKPAQSGGDRPSDAERLLAAAGLPADELALACPLRYAPPLAPGLAEDPSPFLPTASASHRAGDPFSVLVASSPASGAAGAADATGAAGATDADGAAGVTSEPSDGAETDLVRDRGNERLAVIARSAAALAAWEARHRPTLTLVEGAGGLYVPMPGGTWQPAWIAALAPWTIVVGRAGLGTINHCLATIAGLRALGRPPLGFVLSHTSTEPDPSIPDNAAVVAAATGVPHLGTLPHGPEPALVPALLDALLARLSR